MIHYKTHKKEQIYFSVRMLFAVIGFLSLIIAIVSVFTMRDKIPTEAIVPIIFYIIFFIFFFAIRKYILYGLIQHNSILLNKNQFPEVYKTVEIYCTKLNIKTTPKIYLLESGGVLNAFASKLMRKNYIVLYSELLEEFYQGDRSIVEFVIGHELGHIKQNHIAKERFLCFANYIPFLRTAYYRACEYTCDNIGAALSPDGTHNSLLAFAAGRNLYKQMNALEYIQQYEIDQSFWRWFVSKLSTHPMLMQRLINLNSVVVRSNMNSQNRSTETQQSTDYSQYMPK